MMSSGDALDGLEAEYLGRHYDQDYGKNVDGYREPERLAHVRAFEVVFQPQQDVRNKDVTARISRIPRRDLAPVLRRSAGWSFWRTNDG
jgi:hypothetical protein